MEYDLSSIILFYLPTATDFAVYGNTDIVWNDKNIPQPTNEQIDAWKISYPHDAAKLNCKDEAKKRIVLSDWSVLPDVKISNKLDFENYRTILRNYILNPVENPVFPEEPNPIWIQPDIIIGENNG